MDIVDLREDIKLLLGGDIVRLEIPDSSIDKLIKMAYKTIKPYIAERRIITKQAARVVDLKDDKVLEVLRVFPTIPMMADGTEILFDFQMYRTERSMRDPEALVRRGAYPDISIGFEFQDGKLYISEGSVMGNISIEAIVDIPLEELNDERAISWIQKYSIALCKETIGRIRNKYRSSNLPIENDGERMLEEAQSDKDRLESELLDKDFGPSFVLR